jgi:hypothetical protein
MRGPGIRLDLDVRRRWRCPACGAERKTHGDVTSVACQCSPDAPLMLYVEAARPRRPEPKPYDPYFDADWEQAPDEPESDPASIGADLVAVDANAAEPDGTGVSQPVPEKTASAVPPGSPSDVASQPELRPASDDSES